VKFSIILPVKNGGEYVKECVQSILAQSCPDFNLHILENCSTDGTAEWLQTLRDERIIIIPAEIPLSIEENWARILFIQKNEFMTIIGHDDLLESNYSSSNECAN
jgi:glycosyltransferase involved in cell wall biosynthesis